MDGIKESNGKGGVKFFLLALPVCLAVSIVGAIWYHWYTENEEVADPGLAMGGAGIERGEVEDSLMKLTEYIGERDWETVEGRKNLRKVLAFVEGTLSPQNYGFVVHTDAEVSFEEELWPMVWVDVEGKEKEEGLAITVPYDRDSESLVVAMTVARAVRSEGAAQSVRFIFAPFECPGEIVDVDDPNFRWAGTKSIGLFGMKVEGKHRVLMVMGEPVDGEDVGALLEVGDEIDQSTKSRNLDSLVDLSRDLVRIIREWEGEE